MSVLPVGFGSSGSGSGYQIDHSVRLAAARSASFSRVFGTPTNGQKYTLSFWLKKTSANANQQIFSAYRGVSTAEILSLSNDSLSFYHSISSVTKHYKLMTAVKRDPSAHMHVHVQYDSTNTTASDRIIITVNGVRVTSFTENIDVVLNTNSTLNSAGSVSIGNSNYDGSNHLDGYLSDVYFIDGQALTPSDFGEFSSVNPSLWIPKAYTGTYGTNGFHLDFNNGSSATTLGYDVSGNGNNWTPSGISTTAGVNYDWMEDTPTNNYAVLNPLAKTTYPGTLTDGNLKTVGPAVGGGESYGTFVIPSTDKYYWEVTIGNAEAILIAVSSYNPAETYLYNNTNSVGYYSDGRKCVDSVFTAYGAAFTTSDVIGVAVDAVAGTTTFYKNNISQGAISHTVVGLFPTFSDGASAVGGVGTFNFGQRPFTYTPPTGFKALNTANLPAVPYALLNPSNHHTDITVTKSGNTNFTIPWSDTYDTFFEIKRRDAAGDWYQIDTLRGVDKILKSNSTAAETTDANVLSVSGTTGTLLSTLADGTYVISMTKAGLIADRETNTDGSITSTVSANTVSGFSIVTYTGDGVDGATVGHDLANSAAMILVMLRTTGGRSFPVWHNKLSSGYNVYINATNAQQLATSAAYGGISTASSTTFTCVDGATGDGNANGAGWDYVAYCYADSAIQKSFSDTGLGATTDNVFSYTGFETGRLLRKCSSSTGNWVVIDQARNPYNVSETALRSNTNESEGTVGTTYDMDIVANGIKQRASNVADVSAAKTYINHAWAKEIFGGENTSPATAR